MNHDQTFRAALIAILLLTLPIGVYHRLKSQSTRGKTRSTTGGFIHFGNVAIGWHCFLAWADRVDGRSGMDELVLTAPSNLVEVDRSRQYRDCLRADDMDPPLPREELDGYRRHTATAHVSHAWPLSLGPTSLL